MNVAIIGYGKMGREIERVLTERGHKAPLIIDIDNQDDLNPANLRAKGIDVAVEFSAPDAAFGSIMKCLGAGVPVVCGTTAWLDRYDEVERECRRLDGAFFYASNYSVGMNVMFRVNELLARLMDRCPEYDVTIEETHHTQKKDAPSGTAITLAEGIVSNVGRKSRWVGGPTTECGELGVSAVRRSVVPGTHTVTWESPVDSLELRHTAKSRAGLALGAVMAAEFIRGRRGVYSMNDLLGI